MQARQNSKPCPRSTNLYLAETWRDGVAEHPLQPVGVFGAFTALAKSDWGASHCPSCSEEGCSADGCSVDRGSCWCPSWSIIDLYQREGSSSRFLCERLELESNFTSGEGQLREYSRRVLRCAGRQKANKMPKSCVLDFWHLANYLQTQGHPLMFPLSSAPAHHFIQVWSLTRRFEPCTEELCLHLRHHFFPSRVCMCTNHLAMKCNYYMN